MRVENKSMIKARANVDNKTKKTLGYENNLYQTVHDTVPNDIRKKGNKKESWAYGYNKEYEFVNISKDGTLGKIVLIQGLKIGLPEAPKFIEKRSDKSSEQWWEITSSPDDKLLDKLTNTDQLHRLGDLKRLEWEDFIVDEWTRRVNGHWFMNNGQPQYITGSHYFYLRWAKTDIGNPDFRVANWIWHVFWEACKADKRALGMCYLKNRRSGFSFMSSSETVNSATMTPDSHFGILSKTGADAKSMFTGKVVRIANRLPFFFMPIRSGESVPKTEMVFAVPSTKMTKRKLSSEWEVAEEDDFVGLDTKIDWKNTGDNSYDGEKLKLLVHDESGKWTKPDNVINNWNVTRTCLILGSKTVGKCLMGSTCNKQKDGGSQFKELYEESDLSRTERNMNGGTSTGLYSLFIPMEWNVEGNIDRFGMPVFNNPEEYTEGPDGEEINQGVIEWWENRVDGLKRSPAQQNEFIRQFPRTQGHAFRDEVSGSLFNIAKINQHIDHNDSLQIPRKQVTEGVFQWVHGTKDTEVEFIPRKDGKFKISWFPPENMQNMIDISDGNNRPWNDDLGAFGCDPYDIDGVNYGVGSNGALHGLTTNNVNSDVPSMSFFLEYIARPQTSYVFFEDILMACIFYGMPILIENNKPGILRHFKNRGYMHYTMLRPDKRPHELRPGDLATRGIPNNSEDVKQMHATMIETYIEEYIGEDENGDTGFMPFNRTLNDWLKFDINKRTDFDASISSGLALMAVRKNLILPPIERRNTVIPIPMGRYGNDGMQSTLL